MPRSACPAHHGLGDAQHPQGHPPPPHGLGGDWWPYLARPHAREVGLGDFVQHRRHDRTRRREERQGAAVVERMQGSLFGPIRADDVLES